MAKNFSTKQRVKVVDTSHEDYEKEGVVVACDVTNSTCTVRLDGDDADKSFRCDQLGDAAS